MVVSHSMDLIGQQLGRSTLSCSQGLGFRGLGFRGLGVWGLGFRGSRGLGFWGFGFRA